MNAASRGRAWRAVSLSNSEPAFRVSTYSSAETMITGVCRSVRGYS
jgi:hypothetical protein